MHGFYVHDFLNCALLLRVSGSCRLIGHRWVGERRRGLWPRRLRLRTQWSPSKLACWGCLATMPTTSTPLALLWRGETLGRGTLHQHTLVWWFFQCCGLAATELLLVLQEAPTAVIDVLVHTSVPFALR